MNRTSGVDRMLDANGNRAVEGLRVLEDLARFVLDAGDLAGRAKEARHRLRSALPKTAVLARDTAGDVGTTISTTSEYAERDLAGLVRANAARATEALRVIEETAKGPMAELAATAESVRYLVYDLERDLLTALPARRLWQEPLYALVDTSLTNDPVSVSAALAAGGAGIVQLRAKDLGPNAYADLAAKVQQAVRQAGAFFVVNDHVAVAAAIGADGIHVGQDDLTPRLVRQAVGAGMLIGLSCHTPEQVQAATSEPIDYIGVGPMFATSTKPHEPERGPGLLAAIGADYPLPSYAIGGLDDARISTLRSQLPHGVAVAGALCRADDPQAMAQALRALLADD